MIAEQLVTNELKVEKYFEDERKMRQSRDIKYEMKLKCLKEQNIENYKAPDFKFQKAAIHTTLLQSLKKSDTW